MPTKTIRQKSHRGSQRGGCPGNCACGCAPKDPLPVPAWEPPGGMWRPGKVNGLNGGYYYGVQVGQELPDPISSTNLRGGGRRHRRRKTRHRRRKTRHRRRKTRHRRRKTRHRRRKTRHRRRKTRHRRRKTRHRRRKTRHRRRKTRHRRRKTRGGGAKTKIMSFINTIVPTDLLDLGYRSGHSLDKLYAGFKGEAPNADPNVMKQPIGKQYKVISRQPPKFHGKGDADYIVNTQLTPQAQANYK